MKKTFRKYDCNMTI